MATNTDVTYRLAQKSDKEPVREFLRTFFFKDEPLNNFLGVVDAQNPVNEDLEDFSFQDFNNGLSYLAEYNGKLAGVCLNIIIERENPPESFPVTCEKFSKIVHLLEHVETQLDIFNKYPDVERVMSILIISVDANIRGKGIAKQLVNKTKELAKENKCGLVLVECTSHYSALVSKALGFELIYSLNYSDYKVNGEAILKPADPHKAVTVYVSKL